MLYRSGKKNSLRPTCLYSAMDFEIFMQLLLQQWSRYPLKVLDFRLQIATGPRQIDEPGFAFVHVFVLYSADIWHEMMLFFTLWFVLQLWNVPTLKSHISKTFGSIGKNDSNDFLHSF